MNEKRRNWTREELLYALRLYCALDERGPHKGDPHITQGAQDINRSENSIYLKLCNFASLDPAARAGKWMSNASIQDQEMMAQFLDNPKALLQDAEDALLPYPHSDNILTPQYTNTEKTITAKQRIGQQFFRSAVLSNYLYKCVICAINIPQLIIASHIIPWAKRHDTRLDPANGLALCALHDKAFDSGLITIDEQHRLIVTKRLLQKKHNQTADMMFNAYHQKPIKPSPRYAFAPKQDFLEWHRNHVFQS